MVNNVVDFIEVLLTPRGESTTERKVWGIGLETVVVPFLTATNAENKTAIPFEALGAPLRLQYDDDGLPKFSEKSGKPIIRVAKEIQAQVKLMRENYIGYLQNYTATVAKNNAEAFSKERTASIQAGQPIRQADREAIAKHEAELQEFWASLKTAQTAEVPVPA